MATNYTHRDYATFKAMLPNVSGNEINGLGHSGPEQPRPFFWHPPQKQDFGDLQQEIVAHHRQAPEIDKSYSRNADRGPRAIRKTPDPELRPDHEWTYRVKEFAAMNEADLVGVTATQREYVYQGYDIPYPWLIMLGVAMDHETWQPRPVQSTICAQQPKLRTNTIRRHGLPANSPTSCSRPATTPKPIRAPWQPPLT